MDNMLKSLLKLRSSQMRHVEQKHLSPSAASATLLLLLLSRVRLFATLWTAARQASLSVSNSPEFTQTHVHRVGGATQPSHPPSPPSPPAFSLSQHQGLLQWVSSSHQVAGVLELQRQHQSFHSAQRRLHDLQGDLLVDLKIGRGSEPSPACKAPVAYSVSCF